MSSLGPAVASFKANSVFTKSSPCVETDASLAGTCGDLLGLLVLPKPQSTTQQQPLSGRTSEASGIRKNVSFSLRARGPGPAYSSPSSDQPAVHSGSLPAEGTTAPSGIHALQPLQPTHIRAEPLHGEPYNEAVVRRLFRSVQGHVDQPAASPEPQPKAYPGWRPQPQHEAVGPVAAQVPPPLPPVPWAFYPAVASSATGFVRTGANADGGQDGNIPITALDQLALGRVRLAMACASNVNAGASSTAHSLDRDLAAGEPAPPPIRSSPPGVLQHSWKHRSSPERPYGQPGGDPPQSAPSVPCALRTDMRGSAAMPQAPPAGYMPDGGRSAGAPLHSNTYAVGVTSAGLASATAAQQHPAVAPSRHPEHQQQSASDAVAPPLDSHLTGGRLVEQPPGGTQGAVSDAAFFSAWAPLKPQPGEQPEATFEQVHLLLASLNLRTEPLDSPPPAASPPLRGRESISPAKGMSAPTRRPSAASPPGPMDSRHGGAVLLTDDWRGSAGRAGHSLHPLSLSHRNSPSPRTDRVTEAADPGISHHTTHSLHASPSVSPSVSPSPNRGLMVPRAHRRVPAVGPEWFVRELHSASVKWLRSVLRGVARWREAHAADLDDVWQQLREAVSERRQAECYLLGVRLGVARTRLARLYALAAASGAPPAVTAALLSQLEDRLRLKLALRALRLHAAECVALEDLLESRAEVLGPLVAAAWLSWRRAVAAGAGIRERVGTVIAARSRVLAAQALLAWHSAAQRLADLRHRGTDLSARATHRTTRRCLRAWQKVQLRQQARRYKLVTASVSRLRRLLSAWRVVAKQVQHSAQLKSRAKGHRRSRLLLASLAHWRFMHVSRSLARVWEAALVRRRRLVVLGRAMRVWHFYARRCRQLIQQLAGQQAAANAGVAPVVDDAALPTPLRLAALPALIRRLLTSARGYMLSMSDELMHLRAFLRFRHPLGKQSAQEPGPAGLLRPRDEAAAGLGFTASQGIAMGGGGAAVEGRGAARASPRLLISGQWRHKQQVLLLLAQLRRVERRMAEVDGELEAAERDGRMARLALQQRADEIQQRSGVAREVLAGAQAEQQQLRADLEQLDREVQAVSGYLSRCRAVSEAADEQIRAVEQQLVESEARLPAAHGTTAEALAREQALAQQHRALQAAADEAARRPPHPHLVRAQAAERQGRERLLAAQRRLSEALQLKAALMAHWRETQVVAASAPRYAAQRHALRVGEAQQQVVEAAKVVSLAEIEVQDLLATVEGRVRATQDATREDDLLQQGVHEAAVQAAAAAEAAATAAHSARAATEAEQRARGTATALRSQLQQLRQARQQELPQTAEGQQAVLLEPLRAREAGLRIELAACGERAAGAHRELQEALAAAAVLSQQVEAAEVAYQAQLLRLQPARPKLEQSALQLRSRLAAYPSELVRQMRRLVDQHGIEAHQDENGDWSFHNLPSDLQHALRPGLLLAALAHSDEEAATPALPQLHSRPRLRSDSLPLRTPRKPRHGSGLLSGPSASSAPSSAYSDGGSSSYTAASTGLESDLVAMHSGASDLAISEEPEPTLSALPLRKRSAAGAPGAARLLMPSQNQHHLRPGSPPQPHDGSPRPLDSMSASQLARAARSVLGSAALRSVEAPTDLDLAGLGTLTDPLPAAAAAATTAAAAAWHRPGQHEPVAAAARPSAGSLSVAVDSSEAAAPPPPGQPPLWIGAPVLGWVGGMSALGGPFADAAYLSSMTAGLALPRRMADGAAPSLAIASGPPPGDRALLFPHGTGTCPGGPGARSRSWVPGYGSCPGSGAPPTLMPPSRRLLRMFERVLNQRVGNVAGDSSSGDSGNEGGSRGGSGGGVGGGDGDANEGSASGGGNDDDGAMGGWGRDASRSGATSATVSGGGQGQPVGEHTPSRGLKDPPGGSFGDGNDSCLRAPGPSADRATGPAPGGLRSSIRLKLLPPQLSLHPQPRGSPTPAVEGDPEPTMARPGAWPSPAPAAEGHPAAAWTVGHYTAISAQEPLPLGVRTLGSGAGNKASSRWAAGPDHAMAPLGFMKAGDHVSAGYLEAVPGQDGGFGGPGHRSLGSLGLRCDPSASSEPLVQSRPGHRQPESTLPPGATASNDLRPAIIAHLNCEAPTATAYGGGGPGPSAAAQCVAGVRGLHEAACLFYLRKLCRRTVQGLQGYAAALAALAARLAAVSREGRLRWALSQWRECVRERTATAEGFAAARAWGRCFAQWRAYAAERLRMRRTVSLGMARGRVRRLWRCLRWWRCWLGENVAKRETVAAAQRQHLRWLVLRWRLALLELVASRQRRAAADHVCAQALQGRCLRHWLFLCKARRLLLRVFARADELWEEYVELRCGHGGEYGVLLHALRQLQRYRDYRLAKRAERINEQSAIAFRTSLLRVRAFAAWQAAVAIAWHDRYTAGVVTRLLRAWRRLAHRQRELPHTLCSVRRRLRVRGFIGGERHVRRQWLQRSVFTALRSSRIAACRQYARSLMGRALSAIRGTCQQQAALVRQHQYRWRAGLMRRWQDLAVSGQDERRQRQAARAWRHRRLLRLALDGLTAFVRHRHDKRLRLSTAALWARHSLARRTLRGLSYYPFGAESRAAAYHAAHQIRRVLSAWRLHVAGTRSRTNALLRTLTEMDLAHLPQPERSYVVPPASKHLHPQSSAPAVVTGTLLPAHLSHSADIVRRQAACITTTAPVKPPLGAERRGPDALQQMAADSPAASWLASESVEVVEVEAGRVAQVLVLDRPQGGDRPGPRATAGFVMASIRRLSPQAPAAFDGRSALPTGGNGFGSGVEPAARLASAWRGCNSSEPSLRTTLDSASDASSPPSFDLTGVARTTTSSPSSLIRSLSSNITLQDLPSSVTSMDARTLQLWRSYAQNQLAQEWNRRRVLTRVLVALRQARRDVAVPRKPVRRGRV